MLLLISPQTLSWARMDRPARLPVTGCVLTLTFRPHDDLSSVITKINLFGKRDLNWKRNWAVSEVGQDDDLSGQHLSRQALRGLSLFPWTYHRGRYICETGVRLSPETTGSRSSRKVLHCLSFPLKSGRCGTRSGAWDDSVCHIDQGGRRLFRKRQ